MDSVVDSARTHEAIADEAQNLLRRLISAEGFLTEDERAADPEDYAQHVIHVHPEGKYSLVSLVWLPGQVTAIHDHRCWCVVGVAEGTESETRYQLVQTAEGRRLVKCGAMMNEPGTTSRLVPPAENIHRVANAGESMAISLHVYGADIARLGTSVNEVFSAGSVTEQEVEGQPLAWRRA